MTATPEQDRPDRPGDDMAERLARARQDDSAPDDPKWADLEPDHRALLIENALTDLALMASIGLFVMDVEPPGPLESVPKQKARRVQRVVYATLKRIIQERGEISDDPDDVLSAAQDLWSALGVDGHAGEQASTDRLAEIKQRTEKATRGPWGWRGYVDGAIELRTLHSGGLRVITTMAPNPCSAIDADGDPVLLEDACAACKEMARRFIAGEDLDGGPKCEKPENLHTVWVWRPDSGTWGSCVPINRYASREVSHRKDVGTVQHPDAEFIAHSRADVDYLIGEVERLRAAVRKLDQSLGDAIDARDWTADFADRLAAALAPVDVLGEHSSGNNPWANALRWADMHGTTSSALPATPDRGGEEQ